MRISFDVKNGIHHYCLIVGCYGGIRDQAGRITVATLGCTEELLHSPSSSSASASSTSSASAMSTTSFALSLLSSSQSSGLERKVQLRAMCSKEEFCDKPHLNRQQVHLCNCICVFVSLCMCVFVYIHICEQLCDMPHLNRQQVDPKAAEGSQSKWRP